MATIWICPIENCGGEVEPLREPAMTFSGVFQKHELLEPSEGYRCKECKLVFPKIRCRPKYVWSKAKVWERIRNCGVKECPEHPLQETAKPEVVQQPEASSLVTVQGIPQKPQCFMEGIFCCGIDKKKHPATEEDVARFFNPPLFSTCQIMVGKRTVKLDCSADVKVRRGDRVVWTGTYRDLRNINQNSALECLKHWASKDSK